MRRIGRQFAYFAQTPSDRLRAHHIARNTSRLVKVHKGEHHLSAKVAILVLFAPGGLPRSTYQTLTHLRASGYSTLVVSNAKLTGDDRAELDSHTAFTIERPNFGYDFGAYQAALQFLRNHGTKFEHILLMNDSIWFPLFQHSNLIQQLEDLDVDFAGPILYRNRRNPKNDHIQSYMMLFRGALLDNNDFLQFWHRYKLTNNKWATIRKGEMGLSRHMRAHGFTIGSVYQFSDTVKHHAQLDDSALARVANYEEAVNTGLPALDAGRNWRKQALKRLTHERATDYLLTTHPMISVSLLGLPFAKKDRHANYGHWRREFLQLVDDGALQESDPAIIDEIRAFHAAVDQRTRP